MARSASVFYLLIGLLPYADRASGKDDHGVHWVFPPDGLQPSSTTNPPASGLTFYYLDTINVEYTSSFSKPLLYTFCNGGYRQSESLDSTSRVIPAADTMKSQWLKGFLSMEQYQCS